MKAITVRNIPPELARALERRARQNRTSLNRTVVEALEQSLLGRNKNKERHLNHDLDWMVGLWSGQQADAFDKVLAEQRTIDPDLWE